MLDWLIKNPQIIIFLVFGVIVMIGNIAKAKQEAEKKRMSQQRRASQPAQPSQPARTFDTSTMDVDEAERTRRVQEELRRKILARMQRAEPPQDTAHTPRAQPESKLPPPLREEPARPVAVATHEDESQNAYRSATEKLAELEALARSAPAHRDEIFAISGHESAPSTASALGGIEAALHDPHELRRAFLLKEILSDPVSLRPR